jgi:hypothetical protein
MKASKTATPKRLPIKHRTGIGSGTPLNKHKRRQWKAYRGQGRP